MKLSRTQIAMLERIGLDWMRIWDLPRVSHATNPTLAALERAGAVELRADPDMRDFVRWQVRRTADHSLSGSPGSMKPTSHTGQLRADLNP